MNISDCYKMLQLRETATDEEIKKSFKLLAHKYHPDKNPHRIEWANEAMSNLNKAYTTLVQFRFREVKKEVRTESTGPVKRSGTVQSQAQSSKSGLKKPKVKKEYYDPNKEIHETIQNDILTKEFVKIRELTKNELYQYFQYGIYNIARREKTTNKNLFDNITGNLKKSFHSIRRLMSQTKDEEFLKHFEVFSSMIYNFYMASECVNVIDSYSDSIEIQAYRLFKRGDDALHPCEKEIFYDRHNRGFFKKNTADMLLSKSVANFNNMLKIFPDSTWAVETKIKLNNAMALREYLNLFFSEYGAKQAAG
jgi:curved DNA-binding protein CbpA